MVSSILVTMTVSIFSLVRKSMALDQAKADISQNARITVDRLSRELRQTPQIVTVLPQNPADTSVAQPGEIEFEDGHMNDLTYRRYYLNGTTLQLQVKEYYFAASPTVRVRWNEVNGSGNLPLSAVISTQDIAEFVSSMNFYGSEIVQMVITTTDGGNQTFKLQASVQGRN
jgi:Tfp pilus assembly protein PilW